MKISIYNSQKSIVISKLHVRRQIRAILESENVVCDELAVHFVKKKEIIELHRIYFQDPTPTDCISFPIDSPFSTTSGYTFLGEIFICCDIAKEYAWNKNLNPYDETLLYLVHGLLHLIGYEDLQKEKRKVMRRKERSLISQLKKQNLALSHKHLESWTFISS